MSIVIASYSIWDLFVAMLGILLAFLVLVVPVLLLTRRRLRARKSPVYGEIVITSAATDAVYPGIDPVDYATSDEQQTALDRLSQLPQFHRLLDGTLVEWGSGVRVAPCDCSLPPVPHLMISWGPKWKQGIVTKSGLDHYVAFQERVAAVLLSSRQAPDAVRGPKGEY